MQDKQVKLKDILAISGKPGLFQFISQGRNSIIVEAFADKKRMAVQSTTKVSALEDIAIYTDTDEVPLKEIFKKLNEKEEGKQTIPHKSSPDELKALFEEILPDYDRDRVYVSDIKKVVNWYNLITELDLITVGILEDDEEESAESENETEEPNKNPQAKLNSEDKEDKKEEN